MKKSSRYEMRIHPDKLLAYRQAASLYGMPLSRWIELVADNAIQMQNDKDKKEICSLNAPVSRILLNTRR